MSPASLGFVFFVLIGLVLYYTLPKLLSGKATENVQWVILLILSYVFYMWGGAKTVAYLLFTTLITYLAARLISKVLKQEKSLAREEREAKKALKRKRVWLSTGAMVLNFGLLYFVKYWNFTAELINGGRSVLPVFNIIVPLGISFYMFQSIGYVIDVYRGKYEAQKNFLKYALFVSFFPQITQGPIGRYDALAPQLLDRHRFNYENMQDGIQLMLLGYLKKLVIADRAAVVANEVFSHYADKNYGGAIILFGVIFYTIQLYCDFSGGIDIIRGTAKLFGIDMAINFERPFFATSLADFWRRWHISLGTWMRDYLFYPLSLSKPFMKLGKFSRKKIGGRFGKILPTSLATFIIYLVIGIWHGASWKYVAFGLWNGTLITASLLLEPAFEKMKKTLRIKSDSKIYKLFQVFRTTVLIIIGRYITRADGFIYAMEMLKITFTRFVPSQLFSSTVLTLGLKKEDFIIVFVGFILLLIYEFLQEIGKNPLEKLNASTAVVQWVATAAVLVVILLLGAYSGDYIASEFIYKQY